MSRKTDLEESIRESYKIIAGNEKIRRLSDRPEERLRAERIIQDQWELIKDYLSEYVHVADGKYPPDIDEIAVRFKIEPQLDKNKDEEFSERHKRHLKELLTQHYANLRALEQQKAPYGIDVPLHIINSIKKEEAEIDRLKRELENLGS